MKASSTWTGRGVWNILEHGLTRVGDAATTFLLLWALPIEIFSKLALAQAIVAPTLLFFVSPETILYREISHWQDEGVDELARRLRALRKFSWLKALFALGLAAVLSLVSMRSTPFWDGFLIIFWAFLFPLMPQFSGADREFLRLTHHLKVLNVVSLFQKGSVLLATVVVVFVFKARVEALVAVTAVSGLLTTLLAWQASRRALGQMGWDPSRPQPAAPMFPVVAGALGRFSLWQHLGGVAQNWAQTMDLFFLGVFQLPARTTGLYAAALRLANLSMALPLALSNVYSIRLAGQHAAHPERPELPELKRLTLILCGITAAQCLVLYLLSDWIFALLFHSRVTETESADLKRWLAGILGGVWLMASMSLVAAWIALRTSIRAYVLQVQVAWSALALVIYYLAARFGGADGAALANVGVGVVYAALLGWHLKKRGSAVHAL